MTRFVSIFAGVVVLLATTGARADLVERRGAEPLIGGVSAADDGVRVKTSNGVIHFVAWDRVRRVGTDDPSLRLIVEHWQPTADRLWRARSRVERGDVALAEPLLELLFEQYRGASHETALVVAEGLLRCHLARGAHDEAIVPALEVGRLTRAGFDTASYAGLPSMIDDETGLCPRLAPWWAARPTLRRSYRALEAYLESIADPIARRTGGLYLRALQRAVGSPPEPRPTVDPEAEVSAGEALLDLIDLASSDDVSVRRAARDQLKLKLNEAGSPWKTGWIHYAIGLSLLEETKPAPQQRGLVALLHLPAQYSRELPYLAGLALARVATELEANQHTTGAAALRADLARRWPDHPASRFPGATSGAARSAKDS